MGIGTTNPGAKLEVIGDTQLDKISTRGREIAGTLVVPASGTATVELGGFSSGAFSVWSGLVLVKASDNSSNANNLSQTFLWFNRTGVASSYNTIGNILRTGTTLANITITDVKIKGTSSPGWDILEITFSNSGAEVTLAQIKIGLIGM